MSRRKEYCDDPTCPARVSCAHAYQRSQAYAALSNKAPPIRRRDRKPAEDACEEWRLDRPRQWLLAESGARREAATAEGAPRG